MASALNLRGQRPKMTPSKAKKKPPKWDPLTERVRLVANEVWERSTQLLNVLAPERPADAEELDPLQQWQLLESAAMVLPPVYWDRPDALEDLIRLRTRFVPEPYRSLMGTDQLKAVKRLRERQAKDLPDPAISPANPEFEEKVRRLTR